MPIDPKKIAEWRATIAAGNVIDPSAHGAITELLDEREQLLAEIGRLGGAASICPGCNGSGRCRCPPGVRCRRVCERCGGTGRVA